VGVTIHYAGQLRDAKRIPELLAVAEDYALSHGWRFRAITADNDSPAGFVIFPHDDCEPLEIRFGARNRFRNWVKTQFAGPEIHVEVVDFLNQIKPILGRLGVSDEGEFWKTGDQDTLCWHMNRINELIAEYVVENPSTRTKVKTPDGRIIDLIG
jgi:hypothetical protein